MRRHKALPTRSAPASPHAHALTRIVGRCRRRMMWSTFLRSVCVAAAAGSVATGTYLLFAGEVPERAWLMAGAITILVVCAGIALTRPPSLRTVAASLDERLRLADVTVAALDMCGSDDAIASLVVRQGATELERIDPSKVFPVRLGRIAPASAAAIALASVLVITGSVRSDPNLTVQPSNTSGDSGASGPARPATAAERERAALEKSSAENASTVSPANNPPDPARASGTPDVTTPDDRTGAPPSERASGTTAAASSARSGGDGRTPADPADVAGGRAARVSQPQALGAAERARAAIRQLDSRNGTSGAGAGTGGGSNTSADLPAGNGAAGRNGTPARAAVVPIPADPRFESRYRAARAAAEAAFAHDDVPPEYRAYVRRYFAAIQPGSR